MPIWRLKGDPTTLKQVLSEGFARLRGWLARQGPVWLAGIGLIVIGILCLFLSDAVAVTGTWWQGTLDAFGVGFVVGGLVDVLAISGLDQAQRRRENNVEARLILRHAEDPGGKSVEAADALLNRAGHQIDRWYREELTRLIERYDRERYRIQATPFDAQLPSAGTPGPGDTPQAPGNR
jgi:hypothetical protein